MASSITIRFVQSSWYNPGGWLIRWALPRTRFAWAKASHSMVVDEATGKVIHATMRHGVIEQPLDEAMRGHVLVAERRYAVPNAAQGLAWARSQKGKPYDWPGAIGVSAAPDRNWQHDDSWFCHEFCAATLAQAGLDIFEDTGHVTDSHMLMIKGV
jgi:uncharacterized protein YycO